MAIPTVGISESSPAGSDIIALGDNRIREYKVQVREIMEVNHDFPSSGNSNTAGQHKMVTFQEQADLGSGSTGVTHLGGQTIDGKPELVYTDEDDNDIQLTKGGELFPGSSPTLSKWSAILNLVYPIGSVVTLGVSTNPATLFGIGTWTAIAGKVIVGIDAGQTEFDTLNKTGGEKTHLLTGAESGTSAHSHPISTGPGDQGGVYNTNSDVSPDRTLSTNNSTAVDALSAHNNLQPYIVKYIWERTA